MKKDRELTFDYVVVGGGSAGCVVAARLAEETAASVLLLEAGEPAENNPETMSDDGFKYAFANDAVMWDRMSAKQTDCGGRSIYVGTGTGMGGSGAVNGMVYTRGDKRDFDQWPAGWQWGDISPSFEALEQRLRIHNRPGTDFLERALAAAERMGFTRKHGMNDGELGNVMGYNDMNFDGDRRRSSYMAYIHGQPRANLTIKTSSLVERIVFNDQQRAVELQVDIAGVTQRVCIKRELILTAGALETPKLLMLSGVGPREQLQTLSIPVVHEQPYMGKNLHDHPNVLMSFKGKKKIDFGYPQLYGFGRSNTDSDLAKGQPDTCYTFMAAPITIQKSMHRMVPAMLLPGRLFYSRWLRKLLRGLIDGAFYLPFVSNFVDRVYAIVVILGKPKSRGELRLVSRNARDQAVVDPGYYRDPEDMQTLLKSVAIAKGMAGQEGLREWGNEGLAAGYETTDPAALERWAKTTTMTTFHYAGTCKMGPEQDAPVGSDLKLKGFDNVRVADASVIPNIPVSAINAPSMMIAYRAASFILGDLDRQVYTDEAQAAVVDTASLP